MVDGREKFERKLPFELKVLEAALEEIANEMSTEVGAWHTLHGAVNYVIYMPQCTFILWTLHRG